MLDHSFPSGFDGQRQQAISRECIHGGRPTIITWGNKGRGDVLSVIPRASHWFNVTWLSP